MKASAAIVALAFVAALLSVSAFAHSVERVRRELRSEGYDQIEFKRTKFPVWVDACREGERYHLHVDWYGKIKKKTRTGSCPSEGEYTGETEAGPTNLPTTTTRNAETENSSISGASMEMDKGDEKGPLESGAKSDGGTKATDTVVDCKKFIPAIGRSITVPCE